MKSFRENPDSEENQKATKQNQREVFAIQMMAKKMEEDCETCNLPKEDCDCNKVFKSAPSPYRDTTRKYECRICGGDHKEIQCNKDDFALGNE